MNIKKGVIIYRINNKEKEYDFHGNVDKEDFQILINTSGCLRINVKIIPKVKLEIKTFFIEMDEGIIKTDVVFLNGYQTWTNSREFNLKEKIPKLRKIARPIMSVYGDYDFYASNPDKLQSFTYTYIRAGNAIKLLGSISEKTGYTIFEYDKNQNNLKVIKDCSGLVIESEYEAFDLFFAEGQENYVFDKYFETMKLPKPKVLAAAGWTSWYNYYTKITEEIILDNLNAFESRKIPLEIFQIDDGYQEALGDWLTINKKFPRGMGYLASRIKEAG